MSRVTWRKVKSTEGAFAGIGDLSAVLDASREFGQIVCIVSYYGIEKGQLCA